MKTHNEKLKEQLSQTYRIITRLKKEIAEPTVIEMLLWELGETLEFRFPTIDRVKILSKNFLKVIFSEKLKPETYEELTDTIFEFMADYEFNEKRSSNRDFFWKSNINIELSLMGCDYKPTGKMVAEYASDCGVIA